MSLTPSLLLSLLQSNKMFDGSSNRHWDPHHHWLSEGYPACDPSDHYPHYLTFLGQGEWHRCWLRLRPGATPSPVRGESCVPQPVVSTLLFTTQSWSHKQHTENKEIIVQCSIKLILMLIRYVLFLIADRQRLAPVPESAWRVCLTSKGFE